MPTLKAIDALPEAEKQRRLQFYELRSSVENCRSQVIGIARVVASAPAGPTHGDMVGLRHAVARLKTAQDALERFTEEGL